MGCFRRRDRALLRLCRFFAGLFSEERKGAVAEVPIDGYEAERSVVVWRPLASEDIGAAQHIPRGIKWGTVLVRDLGGFRRRGVAIEGSIDGADWQVLQDAVGRRLNNVRPGQPRNFSTMFRHIRPRADRRMRGEVAVYISTES